VKGKHCLILRPFFTLSSLDMRVGTVQRRVTALALIKRGSGLQSSIYMSGDSMSSLLYTIGAKSIDAKTDNNSIRGKNDRCLN
jgi:hypothetical protein